MPPPNATGSVHQARLSLLPEMPGERIVCSRGELGRRCLLCVEGPLGNGRGERSLRLIKPSGVEPNRNKDADSTRQVTLRAAVRARAK